MHEIARSLRSVERFLLTPPVAASFGAASVAVCDLSERGMRFRHTAPLEMGAKETLRIDAAPGPPLDLQGVIVWTQPDAMEPGKFVSGLRTYGPAAAVAALLATLRHSRRAQRIEELRSTERFTISQPIAGHFAGRMVAIEDLSARGARIVLAAEPAPGVAGNLRFLVPESEITIEVTGRVMWAALRSLDGADTATWRAGLLVEDKPEMMRLAIGRLSDLGRAAIDPHSLALKLRILRARARQLAPSYRAVEGSGIAAEQYLLIQGVREELRLNPEEAILWYRRARALIADPTSRIVARPIADHPDALAVWEYLERSLDPSIVARAFEIER